ncbi:MAG: hypothetical protein Q8P50_06985, partial [Bacillota bacterium]|nr:hypothetical protein [Bacillota bacterium]
MRRTTLVALVAAGLLLASATAAVAGKAEPVGPYWPNGTKLATDVTGTTLAVSFPGALNGPYYYWIGAYPNRSAFPVVSVRVDAMTLETVSAQLTLNPGA